MKNVEYLAGNENISNAPLPVFGDDVCAFAAELSGRLMRAPEARAFPDISTLAFWCRKGNVEKMKEACQDADTRLGRGLCFHIAPSNIPINFAFTFLFGLLAGNANLVRLPSKRFPQVEPVCRAVREALKDYPEIEKRTAFVRYPADCGATEAFSAIADARVIWGGDRTVAQLKAMETKPRCIDVAFADRYSVCMLDGKAVLEAEQSRIRRLAEDFYNDTWLMDQNACSSPQLILWENDSKEARERFWDAAYETAAARYEMQAAVSVDKYLHMCEDAIDWETVERIERRGSLLYRAELGALTDSMENLRGKGGYFYEYALKDRDELARIVNERFQTLTCFGIDRQELRRWVIDSRLRGIDRIAPIGKAMDIGVIWDGFDVVRTLSRLVNVEG